MGGNDLKYNREDFSLRNNPLFVASSLSKFFLNPAIWREAPYVFELLRYNVDEIITGNPQYERDIKKLEAKIDQNLKEKGRGNSNPVLLVPGFREPKEFYWPTQLYHLRKDKTPHVYYLYLYSHRSVEENAIGNGPVSGLIPATEILLDKTGYEKVNLIGHSMGGLVVALAACLRPELYENVVLLGAPCHGSLLVDRSLEIIDSLSKMSDKTINKVHSLLKHLNVEPDFIKSRLSSSTLDRIQYDHGYMLDGVKNMSFMSNASQDLCQRVKKLTTDKDAPKIYSIFSENDEAIIPWFSSILDGAVNINVNKHLESSYLPHIRLLFWRPVSLLIEQIFSENFNPEEFKHESFEHYFNKSKMMALPALKSRINKTTSDISDKVKEATLKFGEKVPRIFNF